MKSIVIFIKNNKYPLILLAIYTLYTILTWGKWGDIIFDCFREAIIPQLILEGGKIYKDITCIYPPLAYYLHSILYLIFGQTLNVLYSVSIVITLSIFSLLYFIIKNKASEITAFVSVFAIMTAYTFRIQQYHNVSSWYFPYSYSLLYSLLFMIATFVFFVFYKDREKLKYLYLSFLFAGISIAFKLDFIAFAFLPFFFALKTKSIKTILTSLLIFVLPFLTELLIFFALGGSISDIIYEYHILDNFSKSPSVKVYNTYFVPIFIKKALLKDIFYSFITFLKVFCPFFILSAVFRTIILKIKNAKFKFLLYSIELALLCTVLYFIYPVQNKLHLHSNFAFLPTFIIISLLIVLLLSRFNKDIPKNDISFFIILIFTSILFTMRAPIVMYISNIGNYNLIFYTLALIYLFLEIIPKYNIKFIDSKSLKTIFAITFIFYFSTYTLNFIDASKLMKFKISKNYVRGKGTIYMNQKHKKRIKQIADYIYKETPENSSVLIAPEYLIINYYTNRRIANPKYYNLIPHIIEMYGEQNILEDLKKNPPDYYVWTNIHFPYKPHAWSTYGKDYGQQINNYFVQNYQIVKEIYKNDKNNDLYAVIYRRTK